MQNNISVCLQMLGDARGALSAAEGTDKVFAEAQDKKQQAMALGNQASAYEDLKEFDKALAFSWNLRNYWRKFMRMSTEQLS